MSAEDDDRLLESLGKAIAPPRAEPSEAEIEGLRRAVAENFERARSSRGFGAWWGRRQLRGRRAVVALAAAVALTTTGTAVAVGTGVGISAPLRRVARAVGLPVASPAMARTKEACGRLRAALVARNAGDVRKGAEELRARADELDASERAAVLAEKEALLAEADRFLKALDARAEERKRSRPPAPARREDDEGPEELENGLEAPLFEEDDDEGPGDLDEEGPPSKKGHGFEWRGPAPHEMGHDAEGGGVDEDDDDHDDDEEDHGQEKKEGPDEPSDL